jgi:hypothetical protein
MMRTISLRVLPAVIGFCVLLLLAPSLAGAAEVEEARTESMISWAPVFEYDHAVVVVSGPFGVTSWTVAAGGSLGVDVSTLEKWAKANSQSVDGSYNYEVRFAPRIDDSTRAVLSAARAAAEGADIPGLPTQAKPMVSGYFLVSDGAIVVASANTVEGGATKDVVHPDDVIVQGSLCVGFDCVNGESFGFDTIRLKENNLRVHFQDTSNTSSFPSTDWRIVINDSTNGGGSYFGVEDSTAGRMPFRIEAGAPANSLYVEDYGRVGLGTSVPVVELHIKDSDTPTVRLEQDSSGGWTAQTWDVAGNESNFFVRDATNGSKLPFRIQPNTPSSTLTMKSDGKVGIGTWSPAAPLEIETTGQNSAVLLDRTDGGQWYLSSTADGTFTVGTSAEGGELLIIDSLGNLTTSGTVNGISDRDAKWDFTSVDSARILEAVSRLGVTSWSLIGDQPGVRHLGPTAQDFHAAFGLGTDDRHIALSDVGGVALAAIQALSAKLEERDRQIEDLQQRLEALEKLLQ